MKKAILRTSGMFDKFNQQDTDYELWKSISEYMDGEGALVAKSSFEPEKYVFLGLADKEKDKELFYMIEQDSMMGGYINDRASFETAWKSGNYEPGGCIYLERKYLEFKENCDICGEKVIGWDSTRNGVSKAWAAYFARQEGCTTGKKIVCRQCRIKKRIEKCSLQKKYGEAGKDGSGACLGFSDKFSDEPIERCKRCVACVSFDWEEEKQRLKY